MNIIKWGLGSLIFLFLWPTVVVSSRVRRCMQDEKEERGLDYNMLNMDASCYMLAAQNHVPSPAVTLQFRRRAPHPVLHPPSTDCQKPTCDQSAVRGCTDERQTESKASRRKKSKQRSSGFSWRWECCFTRLCGFSFVKQSKVINWQLVLIRPFSGCLQNRNVCSRPIYGQRKSTFSINFILFLFYNWFRMIYFRSFFSPDCLNFSTLQVVSEPENAGLSV